MFGNCKYLLSSLSYYFSTSLELYLNCIESLICTAFIPVRGIVTLQIAFDHILARFHLRNCPLSPHFRFHFSIYNYVNFFACSFFYLAFCPLHYEIWRHFLKGLLTLLQKVVIKNLETYYICYFRV